NLYFSNVTNGIVQGIKSHKLQMINLNIIAPKTSPNTDGIHISHSKNVIISKTIIGIGDDCIGMIQGSSNITVEDVTCGPGHGI
ncbi:hypothetical protein S245_036205, partial [Arachis hypogaea]